MGNYQLQQQAPTTHWNPHTCELDKNLFASKLKKIDKNFLPCTYNWRKPPTWGCIMSFGSSFFISYLVFKDDIFQLPERYRAQKVASHHPTLVICMARSHYHNSCEANFRTIIAMLWIDVGIKDTPLLRFIIVVNISTNPLLVSKMKLLMQMCHSSWFECILFMYGNHTWSLWLPS